MTQQYDNTNSGVLFKADKKTDNHPDYTGSIDVGGVDHWLSAWIKKSKDGTKTFMSLSVKPKEERQAAPRQAPAPEFDDSIPF